MTQHQSYSVAIRTLGTAGEKYLAELRSIDRQTIQPDHIFVYIPYGYALPAETIHKEVYIRCEKGMVTQRSLPFTEIGSDFILFLDDDIELADDSVEKFFEAIISCKADCVAANIYPNYRTSVKQKIKYALYGVFPHNDKKWALKINQNGLFSYNNSPASSVMQTQTAPFAAFLIRRQAHFAIHYEDERWMDEFQYTLMDDQSYFFKLYLYGFKVLIHYGLKIRHLDAGCGRVNTIQDYHYNSKLLRFLVWYRTFFSTRMSNGKKLYAVAVFLIDLIRELVFCMILCLMRKKMYPITNLFKSYVKGYSICHSNSFKSIPHYLHWLNASHKKIDL